jgi:hypothetical protein
MNFSTAARGLTEPTDRDDNGRDGKVRDRENSERKAARRCSPSQMRYAESTQSGIESRGFHKRCEMKRLTPLLVGCAAMAGQLALAQDPFDAIRTGCAADAQKLCAGVPSGGGRIVACLREHKDALSNQCKQAAGLEASSGSASAPSAVKAPPPTAKTPEAVVAAPVATPKPSASASKDAAVSGAYLRMKQVQVVAHVVDAKLGAGTVDLPALDLLIPSTWDFKGVVAGNTKEGCFRDLYAMS